MVLPGGEKRGKGGGGFVNKIFSFSGFLNNKDYDAIHIIKYQDVCLFVPKDLANRLMVLL